MSLLDGFERRDVDAGGVRIATWSAGDGDPVLLLHGYPQTHLMWHAVAPALADGHRVVLADLRGYGESDKPPGGDDHAGYAKRAMASDQVEAMAALGHERFAVVGHDRGARVGHRLALDHPDRVSRLAVVDIAPTHHMVTTADLALGQAYFHWFFLAQPPDLPERMIGADPQRWLRHQLGRFHPGSVPIHPDALAAYLRAGSTPDAVAAACEDYRAALTIDLAHDEADRHRRVGCPTLALWGRHGFIADRYDPLAIWRSYADRVEGRAMASGHFVAEEDSAGTVAVLRDWLARGGGGARPGVGT